MILNLDSTLGWEFVYVSGLHITKSKARPYLFAFGHKQIPIQPSDSCRMDNSRRNGLPVDEDRQERVVNATTIELDSQLDFSSFAAERARRGGVLLEVVQVCQEASLFPTAASSRSDQSPRL